MAGAITRPLKHRAWAPHHRPMLIEESSGIFAVIATRVRRTRRRLVPTTSTWPETCTPTYVGAMPTPATPT
jgi:hypothetical protein